MGQNALQLCALRAPQRIRDLEQFRAVRLHTGSMITAIDFDEGLERRAVRGNALCNRNVVGDDLKRDATFN